MREIFSSIQSYPPVSVQLFHSHCHPRHQAFVRFSSLIAAIDGLIQFHNYNVDGFHLRISFSNRTPDKVFDSDRQNTTIENDSQSSQEIHYEQNQPIETQGQEEENGQEQEQGQGQEYQNECDDDPETSTSMGGERGTDIRSAYRTSTSISFDGQSEQQRQ